MKNSLLSRLESNTASFSKGQKKIAAYIMQNYDKAAFMTASALGEKVGVSESTVVRFASELGFKGYPEFQKEIQQMIKSKLTAVQRMEVSESLIGDGDVIRSVLSKDIELIRETAEKTSKEDFKRAVEAIKKANKIYILGVRSSAALASFLAFYFNLVFDSVVLVDTSSASEMFEQMFRIGEGDVCIAISFPRYSKQTVNALRFIADRKATVISITDNDASPMVPYTDHLLVAKSNMASVVDSLVAPLSLINALIVSVTLSKKDEVYNNFNELESIWEKYQVYEKEEANADE
ncbi:MAG: MurR/RpiR family transcriptional regulator [Clostridia bacterium]|nr:MurR/RpiR family transcriptional regulator [Clostridia bacterium]